MLGKEFLISWPEFEVRRADETDTQYAAILEGVPAEDHGDPHDRQRHSCRTDG